MFGLLAYLAVKTLIPQLNSLAQSVQTFVTPGSNGQESPLDQTLKSLGFTQSQINSATKQLQSQLSTIAADVANGAEQLIGGLISAGFNILITVVVSIYLLVDGYRFGNWLIGSSPSPNAAGSPGARDLTACGGRLYPRADHHVVLYGGAAVCGHDHPWGAVCRL